MWFIRTNKESSTPEMMHISSRESREWMNEKIDFRLHKHGLINVDLNADELRADLAYLRQWRQMMQSLRRGMLAAFSKAVMGALFAFIGWAIIKFIGEIT